MNKHNTASDTSSTDEASRRRQEQDEDRRRRDREQDRRNEPSHGISSSVVRLAVFTGCL